MFNMWEEIQQSGSFHDEIFGESYMPVPEGTAEDYRPEKNFFVLFKAAIGRLRECSSSILEYHAQQFLTNRGRPVKVSNYIKENTYILAQIGITTEKQFN